MGSKSDYRDLIVDCPACRAKTQAEFMDGATYTDFETLLRSVRPGSVVRLYRPFLLGGGRGRTDKQRRIWAERADAVKAKGGKLASISPLLTGHKLTMRAYEEIGNVARGKAGKHKLGKPPKEYTDAQWAVIRKHWPRRHGVKIREAVDTINRTIAPRKVTAGWLYANVK
jgi:hypothetical protein